MREQQDIGRILADQKTKVTTTNVVQLGLPKEESKPRLVVMIGSQPLREFVIDKPEVVIGRGEVDLDLGDDSSISRKHAKIVVFHDGHEIQDLSSKNGTLVNGQQVGCTVLNSGDKIQIGNTVLKFLHHDELEAACINEFYQMAWTDSLTQINNRRFLMDALNRELSRARRHKRPLSVLMFDIDHFKQINDTYGHQAGDKVLMAISDTVSAILRREDIFGRYGGEEFIVVLPETTIEAAQAVAERIRQCVESMTVVHRGQTIVATVSVGYAAFDAESNPEISTEFLVDAADTRLYEAKNSGRNRCCGGVANG